jgi:integrase
MIVTRSPSGWSGGDDRVNPTSPESSPGPLRKSNLLRRWYHPLLEKAGLQHFRFHDLRHTHATLLLSQGIHPKVVQERLGHLSVMMALDTYSHITPSLQAEAAVRLDAVLGQQAGKGSSRA